MQGYPWQEKFYSFLKFFVAVDNPLQGLADRLWWLTMLKNLVFPMLF
jgi:hypothetical protein